MVSSRDRSKKQSAGRGRPLSLPEDFVLYLDENLHNCRPILDALTQHGVKHERHGNYFPPGTEDRECATLRRTEGLATDHEGQENPVQRVGESQRVALQS